MEAARQRAGRGAARVPQPTAAAAPRPRHPIPAAARPCTAAPQEISISLVKTMRFCFALPESMDEFRHGIPVIIVDGDSWLTAVG